MEFKDEVAWHGSVCRMVNDGRAGNSRTSDDEKVSASKTLDVSDFVSEFIIEDIFVYPQEVTGSTVNTDQVAYTEWLYGLDDDTFNTIRMQGHSHVNMGVSPSGVDDKHRQQILDQLEPDMFYIFMIWNKSLSTHTLIYDMASNILYEDKDVEVRLIEDDGMGEFLDDARVKVQKRTNPTKPTSSNNPTKPTKSTSKTYPINKKSKGGSKKQSVGKNKQSSGQVTALGGQAATLGIDDDFEDFEMLYGMQDFYDFSLSDAKHLAGEYDQGGRKWRR